MLNILKTDFYKAFRTPSFWVISVITILSSLLSSFLCFWILTQPEFLEKPEAIKLLEVNGIYNNFFKDANEIMTGCIFLIGIFAVMFFVSEFNYGTIKNIASKGYRREYIYISKFVTAIVVAIISLLLSFLTAFITAQIMINNKISGFFDYNAEFHTSLSKQALLVVTYISIAILLAMLFRSLGPALSVFLAYFFLENSIVQLINKLIHDVFNSDFSVAPYFINGAFSNPDKTVQGVIVLLVYIVVTTAIGFYTFRKRDIN